MKRLPVALGLSLAFALALLPLVTRADQPYSVLIDGRPLTSSATETGATLRGGVVFVNVVTFTKAFNGLLTFSQNLSAVRVTINRRTANFVSGRPASDLNGMPVQLSAAPFTLNGEMYVPLRAMAAVARAGVQFDQASSTVHVSNSGRAPAVAPTGS